MRTLMLISVTTTSRNFIETRAFDRLEQDNTFYGHRVRVAIGYGPYLV